MQAHRQNPDSEECHKMTRENKAAMKVAQMSERANEDDTRADLDYSQAQRYGHFPELTIEQNRLIWEAREKGWDVFWPSYPSALSQAENTINGAVEFLKGAK